MADKYGKNYTGPKYNPATGKYENLEGEPKHAPRRKRNQKQTQPKNVEIRFHKRIEPHDLEIKNQKIAKALKNNQNVKIRLQLQGREKQHPQQGVQWLNGIIQTHQQYSVPNRQPTPDNLTVILFPKK